MDFQTRYGKLNAAQRQAVDTIDGPVMVVAGPGTGKTELLSMRAANILQTTDTLPENILCLTFTESGASAMRQRLTEIIGPAAFKIAIHTFHGFGAEIINQNGQYFYHGANFRAADELSSYELLRGIFDELDYNNPLASKLNGEYTHLRDTLMTISELKKSGLTSDELLAVLDINDAVIEQAEPLLQSAFAGRLSKATAGLLRPIVDQVRSIETPKLHVGLVSLGDVLADSLEHALEDVDTMNSTKPLTAWRNTWMKKDADGEFILKSRERQIKLRALSYLYYQYLARMQEAELYDFDDMILRVVHAMEVFSELRYNLQEKHQYIMVDEFQDTNMAQMRILYNLTSNPSSEGRPNIMVVGDDDQAIYSFQGADISNILTFEKTYRDVVVIPLTDNYRSAPNILVAAREVIVQAAERLEVTLASLDKTLTPHRTTHPGVVRLIEADTLSDERSNLIDSIKREMAADDPPATIAVLARRHHELVGLLPYFQDAGIAVNYERQDNVLDIEPIKLLETIATVVVSLFEKRHDEVDARLPELLSYPVWSIGAMSIWKLSLTAQRQHKSWMEVMSETTEFIPLHAWLIDAARRVPHTPLEHMVDRLLGKTDMQVGDDEKTDTDSSPSLARVTGGGAAPTKSMPTDRASLGADRPAGPERTPPFADEDNRANDQTYTSPLFNYFFALDKLHENPDEYLVFLEALRTIRAKLRDYQPNDTPTLRTFLAFIDLHRRLGSSITSIRPHLDAAPGAVHLMTAHRSKGLEFDSVHIIGAIDTAWGERVRTRSRLIGYPENLPLSPSGDQLDERLRLFFVAMTRAKHDLSISYSLTDDSGKATLGASFLLGTTLTADHIELAHDMTQQIEAAERRWYEPLVSLTQHDMKQLLAPTLERYKLSATHLNNFLDVSRGGPQTFLLGNLLRFPQAKSPAAAYGVAIHATLQRAHAHLAATEQHRAVEDILSDYEQNLLAQHLAADDHALYLQKGSDVLSAFLEVKYIDFKPTQKVELNLGGQNVMLGDARLTGSLDLVDIDDAARSLTITDYKTGRATNSWTGKTDYDKIRLHKYKQQLMFYQLLMNHSRDYSKYAVTNGILQFVEPTPRGEIVCLEASFTRDELDRFEQLVCAVWQHIVTLDLPDAAQYAPTYSGLLAFEADLLDEK